MAKGYFESLRFGIQSDETNNADAGRTDSEVTYLAKQVEEKSDQVHHLRDQLTEKDKQIDHLTQVVAMSQKNIGALTEQLDDSRQMIEDMRQRRTVWQRLKGVVVAESA